MLNHNIYMLTPEMCFYVCGGDALITDYYMTLLVIYCVFLVSQPNLMSSEEAAISFSPLIGLDCCQSILVPPPEMAAGLHLL